MSEEKVRKINLLTLIVSDFEGVEKGIRADAYLAQNSQLPSRSQLKRWFDDARIRRGNQALKARDLVFEGDQISITPPDEADLQVKPIALPLDIKFEDDHLIVLFKPRGLSMHPAATPKAETTLVNALMHHTDKLSRSFSNEYYRPGIVHRLDKNTEGLVVVAKDDQTHEDLARQFSQREVDRAYWALVWGRTVPEFEVDGPIARHPRDRKKMGVVEGGKPALTIVKTLKTWLSPKKESNSVSWVECKLKSGRTHQIRVHMKSKGHHVLNDPLYGRRGRSEWPPFLRSSIEKIHGQALIAFRLGFVHPKTKAPMKFEVEEPEWLRAFVAGLAK